MWCMSFYPAIKLEVNNRPTRVYVLTKISTIAPQDLGQVRRYIESVELQNRALLDHGYKHVVLLWSNNNNTMADWWVWGDKESESEGAGIEVFLFRGNKRYESPLVTAEDGMKILAREIELG